MAKVTIEEVAKYAGVSKATVSRVLNNSPTVGEDFRQRVLDAVDTLGYQPNRAARRLRAHTSDVLGLIISDIQNPFFTSVVRGVEDAAYARQMSVVLCNSDEDSAKQDMYLSVMEAENVAGLIITPTHVEDDDALLAVQQAGIPIILLDRRVQNLEMDAVVVDNVQGAYTIVTHLVNLGYRRIGIISGSMHLTNGYERYQGYRQALESARIPVDENLVKIGDFRRESGYALLQELLAAPVRPEAIFVANNLMTLGAMRALREAGLSVPENIALVGFDDMPWASELYSPLTVVSQPTYQLGQEAVRLLARRLDETDAPFQTVILKTRLIVRESCGAAMRKLT